ncbi:MAG TPA: hypothetical protein VG096_11030 [Bryobacteraceae bacterium]|jgi:hypothetical protein|nr:hypothetical protein [Bryobacteraceae bacterium]
MPKSKSTKATQPDSTNRPIRQRDYQRALQRARDAEERMELTRGGLIELQAKRAEIYAETKKAKEALAALEKQMDDRAELSEFLKHIAAADEFKLNLLKAASRCLDENYGCTTPTEEFIYNILSTFDHSGFLTPEKIEKEVQTFKLNYDDMVRDALPFAERYQDLQAARDTRNSETETAN